MGEGRRELILGEVVELNQPGRRHGTIQAEITYLLKAFLRETGCPAEVMTATGYRLTLGPDTVRAPDVAVVSAARAAGHEDVIGYLPFAPDLAVEVVSPSDSFTDVEAKARMWLEHGSRMVWVVEPQSRRVMIYESGRDRRELTEHELLGAGGILPGFSVPVAELFG